jgi:hypothetical protein
MQLETVLSVDDEDNIPTIENENVKEQAGEEEEEEERM